MGVSTVSLGALRQEVQLYHRFGAIIGLRFVSTISERLRFRHDFGVRNGVSIGASSHNHQSLRYRQIGVANEQELTDGSLSGSVLKNKVRT